MTGAHINGKAPVVLLGGGHRGFHFHSVAGRDADLPHFVFRTGSEDNLFHIGRIVNAQPSRNWADSAARSAFAVQHIKADSNPPAIALTENHLATPSALPISCGNTSGFIPISDRLRFPRYRRFHFRASEEKGVFSNRPYLKTGIASAQNNHNRPQRNSFSATGTPRTGNGNHAQKRRRS